MSCGCKGGDEKVTPTKVELNDSTKRKNYIIKSILFLGVMILMPIIMVGIIVLLFKHIVLSQNIDLIPAFRQITKKYASVPEEEEEVEEEEFEEEEEEEYEYELMDVEVIK